MFHNMIMLINSRCICFKWQKTLLWDQTIRGSSTLYKSVGYLESYIIYPGQQNDCNNVVIFSLIILFTFHFYIIWSWIVYLIDQHTSHILKQNKYNTGSFIFKMCVCVCVCLCSLMSGATLPLKKPESSKGLVQIIVHIGQYIYMM